MSSAAIAGGTEPISVVVEAAPSTPLSFNVSVKISNNGDVPIILSRAHLPFNWGGPLPNEQFMIKTYYDSPVLYAKTYAQIDMSDPDACVTLEPHQVLSGVVDLHDSYKFFGVVTEYDMFKVSFVLKIGDVPESDAPDQSSPDYPNNPNRPRTIVSNELITYFPLYLSGTASSPRQNEPIKLDGSRTQTRLTSAATPPDGSAINDPRATCDSSHALAIDTAISNGGDVAEKSYTLIREMLPPLGYPPATRDSALFRKWW